MYFFFLHLNNFYSIQKINSPLWVEKISYNTTPNIDLEEVVQGNMILLYDEQIHIAKQENFFHLVTKITENVGVQPASSINIAFDPSYQSLIIHSLKIIRNGKTIDKLKSSDFQTLRRELNAESYIYDGTLSAFTNISDIRTGDIIDYSYTIKGFNPIHENLYSAIFNLNSSQPYGKMFIKIINNTPINHKFLKTDFKLQQTKEKKKFVYKLDQEHIKGIKYEEGTPTWYIDSGVLSISNYKSWKTVIDWGIKVFDVKNKLSLNLKNKISSIKKENSSEGKKINAVLNFVQDDIRYLGLESGIGAYKPFSPNKVFEQRYGDCKDKSLLMVAMLKSMNIEAYPVLVNTYLKGSIKKLLPASEHFNHCIVKVVDKNKNEFWYDPTISNQGGEYNTTSFPDYRFGLVLKEGNEEFDYIYPSTSQSVDVIDVFTLDENGKGASLSISTTYYENEADYMRQYFKNNSISSIQKEYEKYYSKYFSNIKSIQKPKYKDDLKNNIFIIKEGYRIDSLWSSSINKGQITTNFYPYTIIDVLSMPAKLERKTPFQLSYPIERSHTIKIHLPKDWNMSQNSFNINSPSISYSQDIYYNRIKKLLTLNYYYKAQADHVSIDEFAGFYSDLQSIDKQMAYSITTTNDGLLNSNDSTSWLKLLGSIIFFISIGIWVWLATKLYKYNPIPVIESYFENNKQIGGWLILIGIGLCLSPFKILIGLIENSFYVNGNWLVYFNSNNISFNPIIGLFLFLETIVNSMLVVYYPLALILFFKKRNSFPKIHAYFLIGFLLFNICDQLVVNTYVNEITTTSTTNLLQTFIASAIVAPYLLLSERSKETFVKLLKRS